MSYRVKRAPVPVKLDAAWDSPIWADAETIDIALFRDKSSDHRPRTQCKLLYDDAGIYGLFQVDDNYVKCLQTKYNQGVCQDSCVEFFVAPAGGTGYLNFEFNCGGCLLLFHVLEPERTSNGLKQYRPVPEAAVKEMEIFHTMPTVVDPEIQHPISWRLGFFAPFSLFREFTGMQAVPISGQVWRANLYKCGDKTSHPHWASWQPLSETNFHLPDCFGEIIFD